MVFFLLLLLVYSPAYGSMRVMRSPLQVAIEKMVEMAKQPEADLQAAFEDQACIVDTLFESINFAELRGERFTVLHDSLIGLGACGPERARHVINRLLVGIFTKHGPLAGSLRGKYDDFSKREIKEEFGFIKYMHSIIGIKNEPDRATYIVCDAGCTEPVRNAVWSSPAGMGYMLPMFSSFVELNGRHETHCIARSFDKFHLALAYLEAAKKIKEADEKNR